MTSQVRQPIHSVGPDGRPNPQPKGTLEVVNVIGPHLSQARITAVKDANRDPVLVGDVLNNSTWDPFQEFFVKQGLLQQKIELSQYLDAALVNQALDRLSREP